MDRKRRAIVLHFYPRSPCGERLQDGGRVIVMVDISIHALLAESDIDTSKDVIKTANFYPRSPCGERLMFVNLRVVDGSFLSTLSLRRATAIILCIAKQCRNFYPRSPCGERPSVPHWLTPHQQFLSTLSLRRATDKRCKLGRDNRISIHALLAESDYRQGQNIRDALPISIHALLAESDDTSKDVIKTANNFYPRSPCGERPVRSLSIAAISGISIHALLAESDLLSCLIQHAASISIHALLAESDTALLIQPIRRPDFYPRSPCGERPTNALSSPMPVFPFLSTLSLRRATVRGALVLRKITNFYPRSPCGERPSRRYPAILGRVISIHALLAESDGAVLKLQCILGDFYPRSPCGERLDYYAIRYIQSHISIHALLAESDVCVIQLI